MIARTRARLLFEALESRQLMTVSPTIGASSDVGALLHPVAPAGAIVFNPSQTAAAIESSVQAHPGGTFFFDAGTYKDVSIAPLTGDAFIGQFGTTLTGTTAQHAFESANPNVTIQNFVITGYQAPQYSGTIQADVTTNWTIDHCEISNSAYVALAVLDGSTVTNNYVHNNAVAGLGADSLAGYTGQSTHWTTQGAPILIQNNLIADNNPNGTASAGWDACGLKIWECNNCTIANNTLTDNIGNGIWLDTCRGGDVVENNLVTGSTNYAIFNEITNGSLITNNTVTNSALQSVVVWNGANVTVSYNTITGPQSVIYPYTAPRNDDGTTWVLKNLQTYGNTLNGVIDNPPPPSGADNTVTTLENIAYTFAAADFGFNDPDGTSTLLAVEITTLPTVGSLTDRGVAVSAGQSVTEADIAGGLLTFTPAANASGLPYASFTFQVQDNGGTDNGRVDLDPSPNTMTVDVTLVADGGLHGPPNVTNDSTENTQTASGLVITPASADGTMVTHFLITNITGGTLFLNDGVTTVTGGSMITTAQGAAGLKFTPAANLVGQGSFTVQESPDDNAADASGATATATIAVSSVAATIGMGTPDSANATTVSFPVTFSTPVLGVTAQGFVLLTSSGITGASITGVTPSAGPNTTYTVTVNTGRGHGTIELELPSAGTIADASGIPLAGPFPITSPTDTIATPGQNPANRLDVNNDNYVSALDLLVIFNYIDTHAATLSAPAGPPYYDVNGDHLVSPLDALNVINALVSGGAGSAAAPAELPQTFVTPAAAPAASAAVVVAAAVTTEAAVPAATTGDTGLASGLSGLSGSLKTGTLPPPRLDWLARELKDADLKAGAAATIFEAVAVADTKPARSILVEAGTAADGLGLDDSLLDSILVDLGVK